MSIPEGVTEREEGTIPEEITELPEPDIENKPYSLSFSKYNERMCQVPDGLDKKQRKDALTLIKKIGTTIFSESDLSRLGPSIRHIVNAGDYADLFRGLHKDVDLKEVKLSNSYDEEGRLFFYTLESEKMFYFVSIRGTHLDTSHR